MIKTDETLCSVSVLGVDELDIVPREEGVLQGERGSFFLAQLCSGFSKLPLK